MEKREYRSPLRERQTGETRRRIVEAARDLFAEQGYAATTLRAIATAADVSPETVQAHGPKAALLRAAIEIAGFDVEGLDDLTQHERVQLLMSIGRDELPAAVGAFLLSIHEPAAPVYRALVGAAANDPEVAEYLAAIVDSIRQQWVVVYQVGIERGWIADGSDRDQVLDTWCWTASPETYLRLVGDYGWTAAAYTDLLTKSFRALLNGPDTPRKEST